METPESLIDKGPVAPAEITTRADSDALPVKIDSEGTTKDTLAAFDKVKNPVADDPNELALKKELDDEEKRLSEDDGEVDDNKSKELQDKPKEVEATKEAETIPPEKKFVPPTARIKDIAKELEGIIPESSLGFFKKMDNSAKEWVVARLKEGAAKIKELETKTKRDDIPEAWYEHPEAYVLTPEFQKLHNELNMTRSIEEHFRQQLIAIKEGEDWFDLQQGPEGKLVQVKQKADATAEVNVLNRIQKASQYLQTLDGKRSAFVDKYNQSSLNSHAKVKALEKEYFPQYEDPKEFDTNEHLKSMSNILDSAGLKNDRLSGMLSKLYAFAMETLAENDSLKATKPADVAAKLAAKNGPTGDEINKGEASKKTPTNPDEVPFMANEFAKYSS